MFFTLILGLTTLSTTLAFQINDEEKDTLNRLFQSGRATNVAVKLHLRDDIDPIATDTNTFQQLLKKSNMFLDNTLIIPHLLQHNPQPRMLIAAAKWGKSTTLDMIRSFLQMRVDQLGNVLPRDLTANYKLFVEGELSINNGSAIQKLKNPLLIMQLLPQVVMKNQGLYPVVYLNFTDATGENYEIIKQKITKEIGRAYKRHRYLLPLLTEIIKNSKSGAFRWEKHRQKFHHYFLHDELRKPGDSLQFLCKMLQNVFKQRVYLLVDDFDAPLISMLKHSNFTKPDFPKIFDHIVDIFASVFLKTEMNVAAIMTGKFPLKEDKIEWIDPNDYSATERSQIQEYFGYKKQQMNFLFKKNHINDTFLQQANEWYDGFNPQMHYHHPASIARFLKHKRFQSYREKHWSEELILTMLQIDSDFRNSTSSLIDGKSVSIFPQIFQIDKLGKSFICLDPGFISYSIANNYTLPQDYLKYWFGYLVVEGYLTEISDSQAKIPNNEMTYVMNNLIGYANAYVASPGRIYGR